MWLVRETRSTVMARAEDRESGKVLRWEFDSEPEALQMVDRLLRAGTAGRWREQDRHSPAGCWRQVRRGRPRNDDIDYALMLLPRCLRHVDVPHTSI
ncbi:hypothetical protein [Micromonospora coerulea]|uniref:hypothetical protein n=1 Tax=Micromonospora coerulea TaxID=47856 RepID=UPI001907D0A3|nr:hypothetical protein [Micromonospora veneta]